MPRIQSLVPVLKPLAAPRAVACRQHFRFSTATRLRAETPSQSVQPITPSKTSETTRAADLAATEAVTESDSAQPPEPKPDLPSKRPQTTGSNAPQAKTTSSRADDVPAPPSAPTSSSTANTESALKQTRKPRTTSTKADAVPTPPHTRSTSNKPNTTSSLKSTSQPSIPLSPPTYHVSRSATNNLPIYTDYKRGGNLHLTTVRKITGDLSALRDELRVFLNKKNEEVRINSLTGHVVVKGHCKGEVQRYLEGRGM